MILIDESETSKCPRCGGDIWMRDQKCNTCNALISSDDKLQKASRPFFMKVFIFCLKITLGSFFLGMLLQFIIPGCSCDEGAGCSGCGIDMVLEALIFYGFIGFMITVVVLTPLAAVFSIISAYMSSKKND